jgi:hypothetical protein
LQQVSEHGAIEPGRPKPEWVISSEWSRFFWISKDLNEFRFQRWNYERVMRQGGALYANRDLIAKLSFAQGSSLMLNMLDYAIKQERDAEAKRTIMELQKSAREKQLDSINKRLGEQLAAAEKLNKLANTLSAIGGALTLASKIALAQATLGSNTPTNVLHAQSQAELDEQLLQRTKKAEMQLTSCKKQRRLRIATLSFRKTKLSFICATMVLPYICFPNRITRPCRPGEVGGNH